MNSGKILWALEPFTETKEMTQVVSSVLKPIVERTKQSVEPVYVMSPGALGWESQFSEPWIGQLLPLVEKALSDTLTGLDIPNVMPPKILQNSRPSRRHDVAEMLKYAESEKASLIVLGTDTRGSAERLLTGSFTESMLLSSSIPLLTLHSKMKPHGDIDQILFPTDFSQESEEAYKRFLQVGESIDAKVTLFHKIPDPVEPIVQTGVYLAGGGWVSLQEFVSKEKEEAEKRLKQMVQLSQSAKVDYFIDDTPGDLVQAVLAFAKKQKVDLLGLATKAGPLASLFIGSVGRTLVRESEVPVWIYQCGE